MRRTRLEINQDLGDTTLKQLITFPPGTYIEETEIPKKRSGNWEDIAKAGSIWIRRSVKTDRFFVWINRQFAGELEWHDLWSLGIKLLTAACGFREEVNKKYKGKTYKAYVLQSRTVAQKEFSGEFRPKMNLKR